MVLVMSAVLVSGQVDTTKKEMKSKMTIVKAADLPKTITDNIARDYPGFTVKEASSALGNEGLKYHVLVSKGTETETLVYDKDGAFVKKHTKKTDVESAPK